MRTKNARFRVHPELAYVGVANVRFQNKGEESWQVLIRWIGGNVELEDLTELAWKV